MRSTPSSPPARRAKPSIPARIGAAFELALALLGVPVGLIAGLGRQGLPGLPHHASLTGLRELLTGPPQPLVDAILHSLLWVVWVLWAYCALVVVISALGQVTSWIRPGGPASAIFRMRNTIVPTSLRLVLDTVFIAAVATSSVKASPTSVRTLPAAPIAAQPDPGSGRTPATLLAQVSGAPAPGTYTVQRGDTLSGVAAQECGTPSAWRSIAEANTPTIPDPNLIHAGDVLRIPADCGPTPPAAVGSGSQVHIVQKDESLFSIAQHYYGDGNLDYLIFNANRNTVVGPYGERLEVPRFIEPGWRLVIPAVSSSGSSTARVPVGPIVARPVAPPAAASPTLPATVPAPVAAPSAGPAPPAAVSIVTPAEPTPAVSDQGQRGPAPSNAPQIPHPARPRGHTHGAPIRVPGGYVLPASLGALLLGLVARAKAKRLRDLKIDPEPLRVPQEGPVLTGIRRAEVAPSFDGTAPAVEAVLRAWAGTHEGDVPGVLACWEGEDSTTFLLDAEATDLPGPMVSDSGIEIRFEGRGGGVQAIAGGAVAGRLRRGIWAFADGLLVPVGNREQETALHLPLFGPATTVTGPQAIRLVEAMVLAAQGRCSPDDLSIFVVGGIDGLAGNQDLGGEDTDLPPVTRIPIDGQEDLRRRLEAQLLASAAVIADYGLDDFRRHALDHPDDRLPATLVVLDAALAPAWGPLLARGQRLGLAALVVGEWRAAQRCLRLDDEGLLRVVAPGIDAEVVTPCVLPDGAVDELAAVVVEEPDEDAVESSAVSSPVVVSPRTPPAARARLELFGTMRILDRQGEVVAQPYRGRRATREVLAVLATHVGDPNPWVQKETLRNAIWETDDWKEANDQLLTAISEARKWLVEAVTSGAEEADAIPPVSTLPRMLIAQRTGQGYRLGTEYLSVDLAEFDQAFAIAKEQPDSVDALQLVIDRYGGTLLDYGANPDAFTWVERDGLQLKQQKKVVWAAIRLADIFQEEGRPDQALDVLEPLLDSILNDELWLHAMQCEGELPPRGHGARERVMALWTRYEHHLRQNNWPPGEQAHRTYKSLLGAGSAPALRLRPSAVPAPASTTGRHTIFLEDVVDDDAALADHQT